MSEYAGKKRIDVDDVRLGIGMVAEHKFTSAPPRQLTAELAKEKNAAPLPPIKQQYGLRLPPDRFCLIQPNYRMKNRAEIRKMMQTQRRPTASQQTEVKKEQAAFRITEPMDTGGLKRTAQAANLDEDYDT